MMISRLGVKNVSRPSHQSETIGVPQAAASNKRPDGHHPFAAMSARVMFSVSDEDEKKAECSEGGRWRTK